jgi:hypothetical protein
MVCHVGAGSDREDLVAGLLQRSLYLDMQQFQYRSNDKTATMTTEKRYTDNMMTSTTIIFWQYNYYLPAVPLLSSGSTTIILRFVKLYRLLCDVDAGSDSEDLVAGLLQRSLYLGKQQ